MRLTRQHFQLVAEAVDRAHSDALEAFDLEDDQHVVEVTLAKVRGQLASALSTTNEHFQFGKFLDACQEQTRRVYAMKQLNEDAERWNREKELDKRLTDVNRSEGGET